LRVVFAGTPVFAEVALRAIHTAGLNVVMVLTQPDRPAGRGNALSQSAVKIAAIELGLAVFQPATLKSDEAQQVLNAVAPDVMVVAAYGLLLPKAVLDIPRYGCINIHGSLLPRWRGAAPVQRAIQAGDANSGITIMKMDVGLDTGDMVSSKSIALQPEETGQSLHDKLAELGASMIVDTLKDYRDQMTLGGQPINATKQNDDFATYAPKLQKSEAFIDWRRPAQTIERQIRAFDPFPGSTACLASKPAELLKVWKVALSPDLGVPNQAPGSFRVVSPNRLFIACADAWLELLEIQKPGGRRLAVTSWIAGVKSLESDAFILQ
jgi:methionyl-tRNA formyltransferase